jgi:hypothetical protein
MIGMMKMNKFSTTTNKIFDREFGIMQTKVKAVFVRAEKKTHWWFSKVDELNKHVVNPKKCLKKPKKGKKPKKDCVKLAAEKVKIAAKVATPVPAKVVPKVATPVPAKVVPKVAAVKPAPVKASPANTTTKKATATANVAKKITKAADDSDADADADGDVSDPSLSPSRLLQVAPAKAAVAAKPVPAKAAVAAKPVPAKAAVAAKPVPAKAAVAAKPVPAKPTPAPVVINKKLSSDFVGLKLKPAGRALYVRRIKAITKDFLHKIEERLKVFNNQSAWGANRVKVFTGTCKKIDLILVPKYARQVG